MKMPANSGGRGKITIKGPSAITGVKPAKLKVSQLMIDKIKTDGMKASLAKVGSGKVTANYLEGVTRLYGAARVRAAQKSVRETTARRANKSGGPFSSMK